MKEIDALLRSIKKFQNDFFINKDKEKFVESVASDMSLSRDRSIFFNDNIALRFSYVNGSSFSNTVLSLKMVLKYDDRPLVIVVLKPSTINLKLANSTFINKISHSSKDLSGENIRGSFNGTDILSSIQSTPNIHENFETLFDYHSTITTQENIQRIVENTNGIEPTNKKVVIDDSSYFISKTLELYSGLSGKPEVIDVLRKLKNKTHDNKEEIISASLIDNVNIRGNKIEKIITGATADHGLGDLTFKGGLNINVDIKSKLTEKHSNPKAYNIDKFLKILLEDRNLLLFYLLLIDTEKKTVRGELISPLNPEIISCSRIQHHWAGRNTRGVIQFTGDITKSFENMDPLYMDYGKGANFLTSLIEA